MTLNEALVPDGAPKMSGFAGVVLMACLFGRNLLHLHRPTPDDKDDDLNGEFWKRHRAMDNILLNTALALPDSLRLPTGLNDPNIVFMNMNIHTSTICLHQAAIFKADRNRMSARIAAESKVRCISAAAEIANVMRQISHLDVSSVSNDQYVIRSAGTLIITADEPLHIVLPLCGGKSIRTVSQITTKRYPNEVILAVPTISHARHQTKEPTYRVLHHPT